MSNGGIEDVDELRATSDAVLLRIENLGRKTLKQIRVLSGQESIIPPPSMGQWGNLIAALERIAVALEAKP